MLDVLQMRLAALREPDLGEPEQVVRRALAIDAIQMDVLDELDALAAPAQAQRVRALRHEAETFRQQLLDADATLVDDLRASLRDDGGATLRAKIAQWVPAPAHPDGQAITGYSWLDRVLLGVLGDHDTYPEPRAVPEPEMILNQRTPARVLVELARRVAFAPDAYVYDIGAGTGQTALLIHLLSGAPVCGIEVEPAFGEYARARAAALGLSQVTFVTEDARRADYRAGTLFYLYSPFEGAMLQAVLERLRERARHSPIRLATYGPCTRMVALQPWLSAPCPAEPGNFRLALFESRIA